MTEPHRAATITMQEPSQPRPIPDRTILQIPPSLPSLPPPSSAGRIRISHIGLDTFSPVNQNGSFEFDRVLKSGYLQKRTRKTKAWKSIFLVLRPNSLSIYKDQNEDKLKHKIHLSDLTAVVLRKDPKQKRQNMFNLFSPSRNYHLEARSKADAEEWVRLISHEAKIELEEEEMMLASPTGNAAGSYNAFDRAMQKHREQKMLHDERVGSSSPEPTDPIPRTKRTEALGLHANRRPSHTIEYSGNDVSDMSDGDITRARNHSSVSMNEEILSAQTAGIRPMLPTRNASQKDITSPAAEQNLNSSERVVWQGYLLYLKTMRGVRQWKDLWVVVRPKNIALYKNDNEYSPVLIIPMSAVINAVEIDPLSKSKTHCLQIITEEKSYKFCAHNEDTLDMGLGALKSLLAKRKEHEGKGVMPRLG